nr:hypothetical protein [uncultured Rhodopila sp.]
MSENEFSGLPGLLSRLQVMKATGYTANTLDKMVECGVLGLVKPKGCRHGRFQKKQIAAILGLAAGLEDFRREPLLMETKAVTRWTGYTALTLKHIASARGLTAVRPASMVKCRYRKGEIAGWLGAEEMV